MPFGNGGKQIDTSVEGAQDFFANLSVSLFHNHEEAVRLLDGVMVDGTSWTGPGRYGPNVSAARYETLFAGKMKMLAKMQGIMSALNGGEVWGNPLLEYGVIGAPGHQGDDPGARWNTTMACASPDPLGSPCRDALTRGPAFDLVGADYDGAFDEMFGAFGTMDANGSWDVNKVMQQRSVCHHAVV